MFLSSMKQIIPFRIRLIDENYFNDYGTGFLHLNSIFNKEMKKIMWHCLRILHIKTLTHKKKNYTKH